MKKFLLSSLLISIVLTSIAQLNNGLVAYYPFSGNANDMSGNNINSITNKAIPAADRFGNPNMAYQFSGDSNTYIEIAHDSKLNLSESKTISFWHRVDTSPTRSFPGLIYKEGPKFSFPTFGLQLNHDNGYAPKDRFKVGFWFGSGNTNKLISVKESYLDTSYLGKWMHIVATYSYSTGVQKMYFNGVLSDSVVAGALSADTSSKNMQIGRSTAQNFSANHYRGFIDDIRIYNRAISDTEVDSIYNQPNPTLSIKDINILESTKVYPNPASKEITISNITQETTVRIFTIDGKFCQSIIIEDLYNTINIDDLSKGIYVVVLQDKNHYTKIHRLIVE